LEAGLVGSEDVSWLALSATFPLIFSASSAAPATAPSAAPAAALVNTAFNAFLALPGNPVERFLDDLRLVLFLLAPFLLVAFFEAAVFLAADFFELPFEAELVDFFPAGFLAGMFFLVGYEKSTRSNAPPIAEEALPAVDDALALPPGPFKKPSQKSAAFLSCPNR